MSYIYLQYLTIFFLHSFLNCCHFYFCIRHFPRLQSYSTLCHLVMLFFTLFFFLLSGMSSRISKNNLEICDFLVQNASIGVRIYISIMDFVFCNANRAFMKEVEKHLFSYFSLELFILIFFFCVHFNYELKSDKHCYDGSYCLI